MTAVGLLAALLYLPRSRRGVEAMHGKPRRITYRDFSLWPAGPMAPATDASREAFKRTQKQQLDHMWDQSQP